MKLKKPKFWDNKEPNLFAIILYPISYLIQFLNSFKRKPTKNNFQIKTICFGNIYIGGTGKTSLCIKLSKLLKKRNIKSCFVKKFYDDQYDEQKLLKKNGKLFLSTKRIEAIKEAENQKYDIAILDDGLQDNSFKSDISIVCFNSDNWIGNGMSIPSGPLRESVNSLKKYNQIFLNGNCENLENIKNQIFKINPKANVYIGKYEPVNLKEFKKNDNYLAFSGIGNHGTFISMLKNNGLNILRDIEFPDHFQYDVGDISKITEEANNLNCKIITTEKDYQRLGNLNINDIKFIKSEIRISDEEKFLELIL